MYSKFPDESSNSKEKNRGLEHPENTLFELKIEVDRFWASFENGAFIDPILTNKESDE